MRSSKRNLAAKKAKFKAERHIEVERAELSKAKTKFESYKKGAKFEIEVLQKFCLWPMNFRPLKCC